MNLLFLSAEPFFSSRGSGIRTREFGIALAEAGHAVELVCWPGGRTASLPAACRVRPAWPWRRRAPRTFSGRAAGHVALLAAGVGRALVGRHGAVVAYGGAGVAGAAASLVRGRPLLYVLDRCCADWDGAGGWGRWRGRLAAFGRGLAVRRAAVVVTSCPAMTDGLRRRYPRARVEEVEDSCLPAGRHPDPERAAALRECHGLGEAPIVLFVGRFDEDRGLDLLLKAARQVAQSRPEVRVVLVGGNAADVARLRRLSAGWNLEEAVCLPGERPLEELAGWLSLASVLVLPRTRGSRTSHKLYTYMQTGKPIVATRLAMHTQVLDDGCAILVAPEPDALAAGLLQALDDSEETRARARAAQSRAAAHHTPASFKRRVRRALQEALETPRAARRKGAPT